MRSLSKGIGYHKWIELSGKKHISPENLVSGFVLLKLSFTNSNALEEGPNSYITQASSSSE